MEDPFITEAGVLKLLQNIKVDIATSPDAIAARVMQETAVDLAPVLATIFTHSINTESVPEDWKAYSIQALQAPAFDKLIILLGNFHLELAYFGALGTFLADSGMEYILTEVGVLAEGSLAGFVKGKFYNRCTRIHQIIAAVMERELYAKYASLMTDEQTSFVQELMDDTDSTVEHCQELAENASMEDILNGYERFFHDMIDGEYGSTAAYWATYVYLVNRVYRELQRAVRTNDVDAYIRVLPRVVEVCFALNRPNYARWGSLFLSKLRQMDGSAREILDAGAFSIRQIFRKMCY